MSDLQQLNEILIPERRFKSIIFLFSQFSELSSNVIKRLPDECKSLFRYICVDDKNVRNMITKSKSIKINVVPTIITIDIDNNISTYEGEKTIEIIKSLYGIITNHVSQNKNSGSETSSLIKIGISVDEKEDFRKSNTENKSRSLTSSGVENSRNYDRGDDGSSDVRSKVRRANRPIDVEPSFLDQETPDVGISSVRHHIPKGQGHEGMKHSSLNNESTFQKEDDIKKVYGGEMIEDFNIDDIYSSRDENQGSISKKESMDSVKKVASEMQRMREEELERDIKRQQGM